MIKFKHLSFEERQLIEKFIKENINGAEIGRRLSRSRKSIYFEIFRNGGRENYSAIEAQKQSDFNITLIKTNLPRSTLKIKLEELEERIEVLETHIKLIYEQLNKMENM